MNCMRCGRETGSGQVFCKECLADMEKYPVKPGTVIQLPKRPAVQASKRPAPRKRFRKPEDEAAFLKKLNRWLIIALLLITLAFVVVSAIAIHFINKQDISPYIGRNYSTVAPFKIGN